ncbi:major facilitator superfamily domain-containing protein [Crucibulum laeve]|uniref:Major facilitator superfamily domain-containing protein n=1 Tax=Crucibulum laeve TaxID=68775 RepID=A0A5C3LRF3_9AGAR|nr:major facilitator superfamily domain-containing protein [Crucibulum laeve]
MSSERTPLLQAESGDVPKLEDVYSRFSPMQKRATVAMISCCGLLPFLVSGCFVPSIPQIARDLNSTGPIIGLAISLSVLASSFGALWVSSYSTFYGRRPVYLCSLPLFFISSLGVAVSTNVPQLLTWRILQAIGVSPGLAIGVAVVGDMYRLEERGQAMGIFQSASLISCALAPPLGGISAHYFSWRISQLILSAVALCMFLVMLALFPETSHPGTRGLDKYKAEGKILPTWRPIYINPLQALRLLRSPILIIISIACCAMLLTDYIMLIPLPYTIAARYNITNEILIGACYSPLGLGNIVAAPVVGHMVDRIVVKYRAKRGGIWSPEDRLRLSLWGAAIPVPLSVLLSGLVTRYVAGPIGLTLNIFLLFMNGIGVVMSMNPCSSYLVDILQSRSAESRAAYIAFRSILMSLAVSAILPMIDTYGIIVTNTLAAILAWIGFSLFWVTIRYGERMRAWIDIGYSTGK